MNKIQIEKAKRLIYVSIDGLSYRIATIKLSDFYNSQSTNYASCLNSEPFILKKDNESIKAAGYSKNCKAVITLEETTEIKELAEMMMKERQQELINRQIAAELGAKKMQATIDEFDSVKEKLLAKWLEKNNGIREISHKEANQLAWKKQNYISTGADIVTYRGLIKQYFNFSI